MEPVFASLSDDCPTNLPPFLTLPAEIRNSIYKYALSSPDGLRFRMRRGSGPEALLYSPSDEVESGGSRRYFHQREFNQLKRVNRQLKSETTDLELKFNNIIFAQEKHRATAPDAQLVNFLLMCEKPHWISHVILAPRGEMKFHIMLQQAQRAIRLCSPLPQVSIRYLVPGFICQSLSEVPSFIIMGMYLSLAIRGTDCTFLVPRFLDHTISEFRQGRHSIMFTTSWRKVSLMGIPDVSKLRFWPENAGFYENNAKDIRTYVAAKGYGDELAELWVKYAKDWVEHGI